MSQKESESERSSHKRRSIRLYGYDYSRAGAYFVTLVTHEHKCLFGQVSNGAMELNDCGRIVHQEWIATGEIRSQVTADPDEFIVMPNHLHGILWIADGNQLPRGGEGAAALRPPHRIAFEPSANVLPGSLGAIVRSFKAKVTRRVNTDADTPGTLAWQRNYYEHIIRDAESLNRIERYIRMNPLHWDRDRDNPEATRREAKNIWLG